MTIQQYLTGKKILIFGLGRQGGGLGDASYLAAHNIDTIVSDQLSAQELGIAPESLDPKIKYHLGRHDPADIEWADLIIKNPAVPEDHPLIVLATPSRPS